MRSRRFFWGADAKTKYNDLDQKRKDIGARLRLVHDTSEPDCLNIVHKALTIMMATIDVVQRHGRGSAEFKRIFDLQESGFRPPPAIPNLQLPSHLKSERWQMETSDTNDPKVWLRRTSSSALNNSGVENVEKEQSRLWPAVNNRGWR